MAEEKKTNLKDRLKKTQVGATAPGPAAGAPAAAAVNAPLMPPAGTGDVANSGPISAVPSIPAPSFAGNSVQPPALAAPMLPGIPGFGNDVAPPAFVQQQQADAERARRAQLAAADPFAASTHAPGPQEIRLVIDEKPVDDREVGRGRQGSLIAVAVTGVLAVVAGYAAGNLMANRKEENQTVQAMGGVRSAVTGLSDVIAAARTRITQAVDRGNVVIQRGGGDEQAAAAAPQHPPDVDEELITWFQTQPPEPPFQTSSYAGRVGRLRSEMVSKLAQLTLDLGELWHQLGEHVRATNVAAVRGAILSTQPQNPTNLELSRLIVLFNRTQAGEIAAQLATPAGPPNPEGHIPITGPGMAPNTTRMPYGNVALQPADLLTVAFHVTTQGLPAQYVSAARAPLDQYQQRVRALKIQVDALAATHTQLVDMLAGRSR